MDQISPLRLMKTLKSTSDYEITVTKKMEAAPNIRQKQVELRARLWPNVTEADLWLRKQSTGFTTIPRTLPLVFRIMDGLCKGKPVSGVYFELWTRAYDECMVVLNKPYEMAFSSGFSGQRALQTWQLRVKKLQQLGFILVEPGPSGPLSYALILSPYKVIARLRAEGQVPNALYNALLSRITEVGARDFEPEGNNLQGTLGK